MALRPFSSPTRPTLTKRFSGSRVSRVALDLDHARSLFPLTQLAPLAQPRLG